jgi:predicted RNA-binding Zn ribbon-like protein
MDFVRYAERSAELLNTDLPDVEALIGLLAARSWLHDQVVERDVTVLRRFQRELRPAFEASSVGDDHAVVDQLNQLLAKHPVTPHIAGHEPGNWHMHVADRTSSVSELLIAEALMGLSTLVCDLGATRLGVCSATPCTDVFVDTSPNRSRRYCSDRCSSRANVAAYRARQKAVATSATGAVATADGKATS